MQSRHTQRRYMQSRYKQWSLGLVVAIVAGLAAPAVADAEIIDRILARVNDEIITKYEVEQATTPYLLQRGMQPTVLEDPERRREIHREVLQELVDRKLILVEARKIDLSVSEEHIDRWLAMARERQNMSEEQFKGLVEQYGMSYQDYRDTVRQNLLKQRLVKVKLGRQISVSDSEVEERYREQFGPVGDTVKHVAVRHILFQPASDSDEDLAAAREEAQKILESLEGGADFRELAREHSDGPSADKGGFLGTFSRGDLNPTLEEVAFELDEGEHSGLVQSEYGFHIVRVDEVSERAGGDVAERKQMLRQRIQQEKMQDQLERYVDKLRRKAFVDIRSPRTRGN